MRQNQLQKIQYILDTMVKEQFVSGVNCLVWQGGREQGYYESGLSDNESGKKISRDTIFRMYSMSKPITSAAVMMLLEEGKIDLMDPVSLYISEFRNPSVCRNGRVEPASHPVTIQDLLNMTSGYSYGGDANESEKEIYELIETVKTSIFSDHPLSTLEIARRLGGIPLSFEPGTNYQYGLSADILGAVVEIVSEMKFGEFLHSRIFGPLGMNDTGFYIPEEKRSRLAQVYQGTASGKLEPFYLPHLGVQHDMAIQPAFESGGAGLVSTADDYLSFCRMLLRNGSFGGRQILQPKTVEFMRSAHLSDTLQPYFERDMPHLSGYSYGNLLRIMVDPARAKTLGSAGEYGWDGWLGTFMMIDPKNDLTVVFMQQRTDCGTSGWTRRFRNIVYSALESD